MDQPPVITFNLKDRGREHTGVKRNFDIPRIVAAINSPKCQERVRNREMLGYLGHWPRNHFGAIPALGVIAAGNSFPLEPALVTVMLRAYPDGTIEHKTEFLLTNEMGKIAARAFAGKIGGFSSVIDHNVPEFYGFDWVNDPNFSTNRGYGLSMDSATGSQVSVAAGHAEQMSLMRSLLDTAEGKICKLLAENDELLNIIAIRLPDKRPARKLSTSAEEYEQLAGRLFSHGSVMP